MNINGISRCQYTLNTEHIPSKTRIKKNKTNYKYMTFYSGSVWRHLSLSGIAGSIDFLGNNFLSQEGIINKINRTVGLVQFKNQDLK